jgi:hypothetical protein
MVSHYAYIHVWIGMACHLPCLECCHGTSSFTNVVFWAYSPSLICLPGPCLHLARWPEPGRSGREGDERQEAGVVWSACILDRASFQALLQRCFFCIWLIFWMEMGSANGQAKWVEHQWAKWADQMGKMGRSIGQNG